MALQSEGAYGEMPAVGMGTGGMGGSGTHGSGRVGASRGRVADQKSMVDQIMMQRRGAMQNEQMLRLGGPEYFDYIDQLRMNPMATWF